MPKKAEELSAIAVRRLSKPGLHAVGGAPGLHLQIGKAGGKSWILRAMVAGKRRDIGLGGYGEVTLAMARERAREVRQQIRQGVDPVEEKRAAERALEAERAKAKTFRECAAEVIAQRQAESRNTAHQRQWQTSLEEYAYPVLGDMAVNDIEIAHVLEVLKPLWGRVPETGSRLRGRIEAVLAYAIVHGYREGPNVAVWRGYLNAVLPKPAAAKRKARSEAKRGAHHPALPYARLPQFWAHLATMGGTPARALQFLILTAARTGEVYRATWQEIDLPGKLWTIPGERMKNGKPHRVPLPPAAVALLKSLPRSEHSDLVFPGRGGRQTLGTTSMRAIIQRMSKAMPEGQEYTDPADGRTVSVHGFRSTFRQWVADRTTVSYRIAERALAHIVESDTEAAYQRSDQLEKRDKLMKDWARFCADGDTQGSVTPIRGMEA